MDKYHVLARRYRPKSFSDVVGNKVILETLESFFKKKKIPHAFLLYGAHGVGKTTIARILACALTYSSSSCDEPLFDFPRDGGRYGDRIFNGNHPDVLEIDAASHSVLNETRAFIDNLKYFPSELRYKVCILDEVHMLSAGSFNALLKHVEEPYPHVKFIFATTRLDSIPLTMQSRCQKFFFHKATYEDALTLLKRVVSQEKINIADDFVEFIARQSYSSYRDLLSIFEGIIHRFDEKKSHNTLSIEDISRILGIPSESSIKDLFICLLKKDVDGVYKSTISILKEGIHTLSLIEYLIRINHDLLCFILDQKSITYTYSKSLYDSIAEFLPAEQSKDFLLNIFAMFMNINEKISNKNFDNDAISIMLLCHMCHKIDIVSIPSISSLLQRLNEPDVDPARDIDTVKALFQEVFGSIHNERLEQN